MNKKLQKQIKSYVSFAGALLAVDETNGQVVYVDVNPDTLVNADPVNSGVHHYLLDVNIDGLNDFDFAVKRASWSSGFFLNRAINVSPQNSAEIGNKSFYTSGYAMGTFPAKLNYGDTISANGIWRNTLNQVLIGYIWSGSYGGYGGVWQDGSDKYLTFRLSLNGNFYYGWLRIEIINHSSFLLKEYAYNTLPNAQLRAGYASLATGIAGNNHQFIFSQQNNSIHISSFQKLNHANISVYDLLGKEILHQPFEGKETTITIDKKGIYFVEVKSKKEIFRKKVFIY